MVKVDFIIICLHWTLSITCSFQFCLHIIQPWYRHIVIHVTDFGCILSGDLRKWKLFSLYVWSKSYWLAKSSSMIRRGCSKILAIFRQKLCHCNFVLYRYEISLLIHIPTRCWKVVPRLRWNILFVSCDTSSYYLFWCFGMQCSCKNKIYQSTLVISYICYTLFPCPLDVTVMNCVLHKKTSAESV